MLRSLRLAVAALVVGHALCAQKVERLSPGIRVRLTVLDSSAKPVSVIGRFMTFDADSMLIFFSGSNSAHVANGSIITAERYVPRKHSTAHYIVSGTAISLLGGFILGVARSESGTCDAFGNNCPKRGVPHQVGLGAIIGATGGFLFSLKDKASWQPVALPGR